MSTYGSSKLLGEWFAAEAPGAYVLRVESLFGGPRAKSSIDKILASIQAGQPTRVFGDRTVTPSYVEDVASVTEGILDAPPPAGLYHCVNSGVTTWLGIARGSRAAARPAGRHRLGEARRREARRAPAALLRALEREARGGRVRAAVRGRMRSRATSRSPQASALTGRAPEHAETPSVRPFRSTVEPGVRSDGSLRRAGPPPDDPLHHHQPNAQRPEHQRREQPGGRAGVLPVERNALRWNASSEARLLCRLLRPPTWVMVAEGT